ncbi:MAG: hypothetical protein AAFV25_05540 [Bacteroidota bacterium]
MRAIILMTGMLWSFFILPEAATTTQSPSLETTLSTSWTDGTSNEDQEQPFAVCIDQIEVELMAVTGTAKLKAGEIEAGLSRDNQTAYRKLHFSFSEDTKNTHLTFDCHNKGRNIIELWVTDEAGNQDYCTTVVNVKDLNRVCGMSLKASSLASLVQTSQRQHKI